MLPPVTFKMAAVSLAASSHWVKAVERSGCDPCSWPISQQPTPRITAPPASMVWVVDNNALISVSSRPAG